MNEYFDCENRMHGIEVSFENTIFNFINIYAPNSSMSQCEFIQTLYTYLSSKKKILSVEISIILKIVNMRKKIIRIGKIFIKILI
jgi:hypothetical protein